jgi:hypothetical protein
LTDGTVTEIHCAQAPFSAGPHSNLHSTRWKYYLRHSNAFLRQEEPFKSENIQFCFVVIDLAATPPRLQQQVGGATDATGPSSSGLPSKPWFLVCENAQLTAQQ